MLRTWPAAVLALGLPALGGCFSMGGTVAAERPVATGAGVREDTRMTQVELDQLCLAFGERYLIGLGNACNQVERMSKEPDARARAHSFKLQAASSVYDILSGPNPFAKLMDLILLAELEERVWSKDGVAGKVFGAEAARPLAEALARGTEDVWTLAGKVLKPEQRQAMAEMIDDWRAKNPSAESVAFVRFSDFAEYRGKSILDGVPLGSGLLAPVSEATRQLEEARMLAERGLFLSKRLPLLMRWHAESFLNTTFGHAETRKLSETAQRAVALAESLPAKVAEERAILLKTLEARETAVGKIAADVRASAADVKTITQETHALLKESEAVIKAADALAARLAPPAGSEAAKGARAFDVREYTQTIQEGLKALHEARGLLESTAWSARLTEVNQAAQARVDHAGDQVRSLMDGGFWRIAGLSGLIFALAVAYRALGRRGAPSATAR